MGFLVRCNRAIGSLVLWLFVILAISSPASAQTDNLKIAPWWYFQKQIEEFFAGSDSVPLKGGPIIEEGGSSSEPNITETDKEWIVEICGVANPLNPDKTICFILYINKITGNVRIVVKGLIPLDLTYFIKCKKDGTCEIVDAFWPSMFGTRFCTISRDAEGRVSVVCNFSYLGIEVQQTFQFYIKDGLICLKVGDRAPSCRPLHEDVPAWLLEIWQDVNPPWLPPFPADPMGPPAPNKALDPVTQSAFGG